LGHKTLILSSNFGTPVIGSSSPCIFRGHVSFVPALSEEPQSMAALLQRPQQQEIGGVTSVYPCQPPSPNESTFYFPNLLDL